MNRRAVAGAVLGLLLVAQPGRAQISGVVTVDAVVVTVGLSIATLANLDFGVVPKGIATTVPYTAAGAGAWQVTGSQNAFVSITFTLPTQLANVQAAPGSTMPISFSATSAGWRRANCSAAGATTFNPAVGTVGRLGPPPNPTMCVWIGGAVTPAAAAKPGIYQGTIILSLVYT